MNTKAYRTTFTFTDVSMIGIMILALPFLSETVSHFIYSKPPSQQTPEYDISFCHSIVIYFVIVFIGHNYIVSY